MELSDPQRLKVARAIAQKDSQELAEFFGYSKSYMSKMEVGNRRVPEKVKAWVELTIKRFVKEENNV